MSTNKNAHARYRILDNCLRNRGRRYSFKDLLDACNTGLSELDSKGEGVSVRTLRADLSYLESSLGYGADIERLRVGKQCYYRYRDPDFSINNQPLNAEELIKIKGAVDIISRFSGMPQFVWVEEILTKINNGFNITDKPAEIISFDSNQYLKGIEFLGRLFNDICNGSVIEVNYKPFKADVSVTMVLHPYYLKQYNNRWFLFGLNDEYGSISNLALDRIVDINPSKIEYKKNTEIDFVEYFDDFIGVTRPRMTSSTLIEIWFTNDEAPYVLTKPIHGSQKTKSNNQEGLIITVELMPNVEFEKLIMSFGEKAKVLSPPEIVSRFKLKFMSALEQYQSPDS